MNGYYLDTSPDHDRAHKVFVKWTNAERVSKTVFFKHKYPTNPTVTHADRVVQVAKELYNILNKKKQKFERFIMEGLQELSKMYLKHAEQSNRDDGNKDINQ